MYSICISFREIWLPVLLCIRMEMKEYANEGISMDEIEVILYSNEQK
jgi:hypothetical protein